VLLVFGVVIGAAMLAAGLAMHDQRFRRAIQLDLDFGQAAVFNLLQCDQGHT